jgi:hypothetical protein
LKLAESLTSSSEATGNPKDTWGDEHYKPPWGLDPISFPDDPSWAENNEINERLAREQAISGGYSPPPKLPENNLFSGALVRIQTVSLRLVRGLRKTQSQIYPTSYPYPFTGTTKRKEERWRYKEKEDKRMESLLDKTTSFLFH